MFLQLFLLSVVIVGIAFAGFAVKMFFQKDGMFKKQCSSSIIDKKTGKHLECAGGGSCHSPVVEEINYQQHVPTSRLNIKKLHDAAAAE